MISYCVDCAVPGNIVKAAVRHIQTTHTMNTQTASDIVTSKNPPLSVAQMAEALDSLLTSGRSLTREEKEGVERISHILKCHSDRTLERLLNGWTEANYTSVLSALKEYCEYEYNKWVLTPTHNAGGIAERVECVRQIINVIHRAEDLGIEFVTTEEIRYARSNGYPLLLKEGTSVFFRAGRWVHQSRKGRPAYLIPSDKVRRLVPDVCKK